MFSWAMIGSLFLFGMIMLFLGIIELLWKFALLASIAVLDIVLQTLNFLAWILRLPNPSPRKSA